MTGEPVTVAALLARLPGYLPEWRPRPGDPGYALLEALAYVAGLAAERLDQVPDRVLLAFLESAGIDLLAPNAARAPVVLRLAADTPVDVALPAGTEFAVPATPPLPTGRSGVALAPPDPVVFTTDVATSLSRARLAAAVSVVPAEDRAAVHALEPGAGPRWFDDLELVPHELYLGHDTLFALPPTAEVSLQIGQTRALAAGESTAPVRIHWEYLSTEGWLAFEPVVDQTRNLTLDGEVLLRKETGAPSALATIDGTSSYWIRGVTRDPLPPPAADPQVGPLPRLDIVRVRLTNRTGGLPADAVVAGGLPVDPTTDFFPFGPQPEPGGAFAVACNDAFTRTGARITLTFRLAAASDATPTPDLALVHEYGTGPNAWHPLAGATRELLDGGGDRTRRISFVAPADWTETDLAGQRRRWLRIRIAAGSYGAPPTYRTVQNADGSWQTIRVGGAAPPVVAMLTAGYAFSTPAVEPDHFRTRNQFSWADHREAIRWGGQPFAPFRSLPDSAPAAYLGFDRPLPVGLVGVFADRADEEADGAEVSPAAALLWEYRSPSGWSDLSVRDATAGFQRSGMIQFIGPPDLVPDDGPPAGGVRLPGTAAAPPLYWLRARARSGGAPDPRPLRGLYLNAVPATARRAVRDEPLGRGDGAPGLRLAAQRAPVLPGERVEVQEWAGGTREWPSLFAGLPPSRLRQDLDPRGAVRAVWVTWEPRPHLLSSGPHDRHYTVDRLAGTVRFGDGVNGAVPAPGAAVRMTYDHGGGVEGNVPAGAVAQLHSAVPYVEAVANPLPVDGGSPPETVARVRVRGPQRLHHRGRAVAAGDYEALAREASSEVAIARCLPATGSGPGEAGRVTVVIAPFSRLPRPLPSRDLVDLVRDHLAAAAPAAVAAGIRVVGPRYTPIAVQVSAVVADAGAAGATEAALRTALEDFLHPVTGGPHGTGWQFGQAVYASTVARLLESVAGVDQVTALILTSGGAVRGDRADVPDGALPASDRHVIRLALGA